MEARNFGLLRKSWVVIIGFTVWTTGCFGGNDEQERSLGQTETAIQERHIPGTSVEPFEYPMQSVLELTLMTEFPDMGMPNRGPIDDEYERRTGIPIRHLGGVPMQDNKFKYLLASGSMPDIFMNNWLQYPGGPEKAIEQGYILPLNDVIDRYAPNFK